MPPGSNSDLRTNQAFLTYRYPFGARPEGQIGAAVGLGAIFLKSELDAEGRGFPEWHG
ncbi:MAG TPA: hypothetical protein VFZ90_16000 [Gemmatimonadales bacterium]